MIAGVVSGTIAAAVANPTDVLKVCGCLPLELKADNIVLTGVVKALHVATVVDCLLLLALLCTCKRILC